MTVAGVLVGYVARLFSSEAKLSREMSFIKGQLTQITKMLEYVEDLRVKHATLSVDHDKTKRDMDEAHRKIRKMQEARGHADS